MTTYASSTTVYLLRHAESQPDRSLPEPEWPLSERGCQQAAGLTPVFGRLDIGAVYSSPFPRAIDTVRPFADARGLPINTHPDLRERKLAAGPVPNFRELLRQTWQDFQFAAPGGESSAACQARVRAAVSALAEKHHGATLLLASHGNAIGLYLNSIDPSFGYDDWAAMKNPDTFRVIVHDGRHTWDKHWKSS